MKRLFLIIVLTLIVFFPVVAKSFTLSSINISFEIPDSYTYKNQYIPDRFQYFAAYNPIPADLTFVITCVPDSSHTQLDSLSDTKILELTKSDVDFLKQSGITVLNYSIKNINDHKYLLMELRAAGLHQIQYQTMRDGRGFVFTFVSYSFTTKTREEVEYIMKTLKYF